MTDSAAMAPPQQAQQAPSIPPPAELAQQIVQEAGEAFALELADELVALLQGEQGGPQGAPHQQEQQQEQAPRSGRIPPPAGR